MMAAYHQPEALGAALDLIAKGAVPIAGATGLYAGRAKRDHDLVDVTRLGLDTIEIKENEVRLGATLTLVELANATQIPGMPGAVLRKAARFVASAPLRNVITLGGNLAHLMYWADMPVALLALDASVEVQRAGGKSSSHLVEECLREGKKIWDGGLITSIRVPVETGVVGFGYERFARTATDYAFASSCVTMGIEQGKATKVRIVLGAVSGRPTRLKDAEALVTGHVVDAALCEAVEKKVREVVQVAPNFRAPAEYRRELAAVLTGRAVQKAWTWATREDG